MSKAGSQSADTSWVPRAGDVIAARYRIEGVIGVGGMGAVVSATHIGLQDRVAVKFLHPKLTADKEAIERFVREAQATSRIKCDHVVRMLDVGSTDAGLPYIVMELLPGQDLAQRLASGPLPIALAVDCALQAAEALAEAHAVGIVHRDVKPSNLLLTERSDGTPLLKVLDFGISKLAPIDGRDKSLTETQAVFGSPTYMSPEQIRSAKRVDERTDVWALGAVLHELISGRLPFDGETVAAVLAAVAADAPMPLRGLMPETPPEIEAAVLHALEKDPTRRSTLLELSERLRPFASKTGRISADRITGIAAPNIAPIARRSTPAPPTSSAPSPLGVAATTAFGVTEPKIATAPGTQRGAGRARLVGAGLVIAVAVVAVIAITRGRSHVDVVGAARPQAASNIEPSPAQTASTPATAESSAQASPVASSSASPLDVLPPSTAGTKRRPRPTRHGEPPPSPIGTGAAATAAPSPTATATATPTTAPTSEDRR